MPRPPRKINRPVIFQVQVVLASPEKKAEPKLLAARQNVNGLKTKPSYRAMVSKALIECRDNFHGMKLNDICKYLETNYPMPADYRRFLKACLKKEVEDGVFVQIGRNYKISLDERHRLKKKTKRSSRVKPAKEGVDAKKKSPKKRSVTKTKEGDDKKKTTKKKRSTKKVTKETDEKKKKKRASAKKSDKKEKETPKKRKRVGKVDDEEEEKPRKKAKKDKKSTSESSEGDNTLVWFWQYFHEGWCNYHPDASEVVEATYQEYLRNPGITDVRSVESGEWNYMVDFRQMTQQNVRHVAHTVRRIRRVQIPKKDTTYRKKFAGTENDRNLV